MSFDATLLLISQNLKRLNPFRAGRCLSTMNMVIIMTLAAVVSIPFEQGDVFRPEKYLKEWLEKVSIPFEQGDVFRQHLKMLM